MKKRDTWRSFTKSGTIMDYLVYRQALGEKSREPKEQKRQFLSKYK